MSASRSAARRADAREREGLTLEDPGRRVSTLAYALGQGRARRIDKVGLAYSLEKTEARGEASSANGELDCIADVLDVNPDDPSSPRMQADLEASALLPAR